MKNTNKKTWSENIFEAIYLNDTSEVKFHMNKIKTTLIKHPLNNCMKKINKNYENFITNQIIDYINENIYGISREIIEYFYSSIPKLHKNRQKLKGIIELKDSIEQKITISNQKVLIINDKYT